MKNPIPAFVFAAALALSGCDNGHVSANVPPKEDFRAFLIRDLTTYFHRTNGKDIVDYELLRDGPTQVGVAYPKYYVWVTITMPDKSVLEGAARVAAEEKRSFRVTNFISRSDIIANPAELARVFPKALLDKIRTRAGVK
jgi:hypothetical protein